MKFILMLVAVLLAQCPVTAEVYSEQVPVCTMEDPFMRPEITDVKELHHRSQEGDREATLQLVEKLELLATEQPSDMLIKSYLGSAYALRARDIGFGPKAAEFLRLGYDTMNEAVEAAPEDICPRFIRAATNMHLPILPFFPNPRRQARQDFQELMTRMEMEQEFISDQLRQVIYYYAGLSLKQLKQHEEAVTAWEKGLQLQAGSPMEEKIVAALKRHSG